MFQRSIIVESDENDLVVSKKMITIRTDKPFLSFFDINSYTNLAFEI